MRFNLSEWDSINGKKIKVTGRVQLRCARPFTPQVVSKAPFVLSGFGTVWDLYPQGEAEVTVEPDAPVYFKRFSSRAVTMTGEVFTNLDRMPQESGTVAEVTKARRLQMLEHRAMMREARAESKRLADMLAKAQEKPAKAKANPKADPAVDLETKADAEGESESEGGDE